MPTLPVFVGVHFILHILTLPMSTGVQEKLGIVNDGVVYAVFDFAANHNDELSFCINDEMTVLRKGDEMEKEWWWARKTGTRDGYIPRNLLGVSTRKV